MVCPHSLYQRIEFDCLFFLSFSHFHFFFFLVVYYIDADAELCYDSNLGSSSSEFAGIGFCLQTLPFILNIMTEVLRVVKRNLRGHLDVT